MARFRWPLLLGLTSLFLAVLFQVPQWVHTRSPLYRGIPVELNSDEGVYLARVEEALNGRPGQSAEAFVGDPGLRGSQPAVLEAVVGTAFRPTGLHAPAVLTILDSIVPVLVFLNIILFFRLAGFSRPLAYGGASLFIILTFYSLNRPIHQGLSFTALLMAINCLGSVTGRKPAAWIVGGLLLGLLTGAYFWSWTMGWAYWGVLVAAAVFHLARRRGMVVPGGHSALAGLAVFGAAALAGASPFLWELWEAMRHPLGAAATFRSGIRYGHLPESWPYSVLFATMAVCLGASACRDGTWSKHRPALALVFAAFIVINQQVVHGIIFNFVSHYAFSMVLAGIAVLLTAATVRSPRTLAAGLAAVVYLAAIGYDNRSTLKLFKPLPGRFTSQHFADLLPVLDREPRMRILSDPETQLFLAGITKHDVVYSLYLKNVLMSHEEIAERYCLSVLPVDPGLRNIPARRYLIYPDANSAFREDPSVREREVHMVEEACRRLDADPAGALQKYGVDLLVWDEQREPDWNVERLGVPLAEVRSGSGWSLWKVL